MLNIEQLLKKHKESVLINLESLRTGVLFRNSAILKNSNSWHAFILYNVPNPERNEILKIVLDHLYPLDLIPVKFKILENACMFMARNCADAIEKLCRDNLLIPNPINPMSPFRCEIILQYSSLHQLKVNVQKNVTSVLHTLYDAATKTLDLSNFSENPGLFQFCPLSQPKIMYFVLHIALGVHPTCIKLNNNEIHSLFPIEALWSSSSVTHLDLRNNKIDDMASLDTLKMLNLTELWLDGNPLCNNIDEYSYVEQIRTVLPKLVRLDGIILTKNGAPAFIRNYLCNHNGFDLVDQFIEYYFTTYDTDRKLLEGLYHPNAMCSITNVYKSGQSTSSSARLRPYQVNNRNLLAMADLSRSQQFLIRGNKCIIRKLIDLPKTEHDAFSMFVDLMYYSENCAVISVSGLYRQMPEALLEPERYLGFNRTFVLTGCNGEYSIVNDMLHVYNALTYQAARAFSITNPVKCEQFPKPVTSKEREIAIEAVYLATGISKEWAKRLLVDANYDVIECIKTFVQLFKVDKIPAEAFEI
ncbi:hypothetical protein WA026_013659 [Henosepilachna vigintioctopunctata]|uniref:Nuclear RNA export factor 2 n=1 Tax=Henosepilachna vigintioctopunctata TaxID=420089 RepID=A0AAW1UTI3_9CUCU